MRLRKAIFLSSFSGNPGIYKIHKSEAEYRRFSPHVTAG